jgi:hypothetical protein
LLNRPKLSYLGAYTFNNCTKISLTMLNKKYVEIEATFNI